MEVRVLLPLRRALSAETRTRREEEEDRGRGRVPYEIKGESTSVLTFSPWILRGWNAGAGKAQPAPTTTATSGRALRESNSARAGKLLPTHIEQSEGTRQRQREREERTRTDGRVGTAERRRAGWAAGSPSRRHT